MGEMGEKYQNFKKIYEIKNQKLRAFRNYNTKRDHNANYGFG
jgi:uncharacterized protein YktA (UPF0223 family)